MGEPDWLGKLIANDKLEERKPVLCNLQGNILSNHGREYSVHIFLRFLGEKEAKGWIAGIAQYITSAQKQLDEARNYQENNRPGDVFWCFFLSAHGYDTLKIPQPLGPAFERMANRQASAEALKQQVEGTLPTLNDPPKDTWEEGYRDPIDAMLLIADDEQQNLPWADQKPWEEQVPVVQDYLEKWGVRVQDAAEVCAIEYGRIMRVDGPGHLKTRPSKEHFGYVDGRSQPLFFEKDVCEEEKEKGGTNRWDPAAGPSLVLVEDPNGGQDTYGSYLVFRKLRQDVDGFETYLQELATALNLQESDQPKAAALVMGRFRDGTPIVLQATPGKFNPVPNNFDYTKDPQGARCPFQAHIRKMNPRGESDLSVRTAVDGAAKRLIAFKRLAVLKRLAASESLASLKSLAGQELNALSSIQERFVEELNKLSVENMFTEMLAGQELTQLSGIQRLAEEELTELSGIQRLAGQEPTQLSGIQRLAGQELTELSGIQRDLTEALKRLSVKGQDVLKRLLAKGQDVMKNNYDEKHHRIARRSMSYGVKGQDQEVGLLFMCYQSDISQQFEFLQGNWANNDDFPPQETRLDAMIGNTGSSKQIHLHKWPKQWNTLQGGHACLNFQSFVTLKGGEYFFAPSLPFLRDITKY